MKKKTNLKDWNEKQRNLESEFWNLEFSTLHYFFFKNTHVRLSILHFILL